MVPIIGLMEGLEGIQKKNFEESVIHGTKGSRQLVLRVLLEDARGCPISTMTNASLIQITGLQLRGIRYILSHLRDTGKIWTSVSGGGPRTIVFMDHPDAAKAIWSLGDARWYSAHTRHRDRHLPSES